jgi:hypothetical protein
MPDMTSEQERLLSEQLASLARRSGEMEAPVRVEAALLDAFRQKNARVVAWPLWLAAAAAVVVIFLVTQRTPAVLQPVQLAPMVVNESAPVASELKVVTAPRVAKARSPRAATRREIMTDFFAMRTGPLVDPGEFSSLVRMSVPRSAMSQFGLPVDVGSADSAINADVLIGQDGIARAIRFVR